jgi:SAM-dependent methyltransferase
MSTAPPRCRGCGAALEHVVLDLGLQPVSNAFLTQADLAKPEPKYPLRLWVCGACFLAQVEAFEAPERHFSADYAYFSSYSDSWLAHARGYVDSMIPRFALGDASQVIEIASNDGYLLQYFVERRVPVLGVEPAANVAAAAEQKGVPTLRRFFGAELARELAAQDRQADLLLGNNVLAHVPDLNDFVAGLKLALKPAGVITLEFPHLLRMIEGNQWDTIYHEHFSYLSLLVVEPLLARHGLVIFDVDEIATHGGSLRIYARHAADDTKPRTSRVAEVRDAECAAQLDQVATYVAFGERAPRTKASLRAFLEAARRGGKRVAGYGAPAKGNTLLNYCGITTDLLPYTVDRSPQKQGRFLPGTHIPVHAPARITETRPDYVLILPWNITAEIVTQLARVRDWGGRFVVPIPEATVLP